MHPPAFTRPVRALGSAVLLAVALAAFDGRPAEAYYEESHVTADEVRVTVDTSGGARIEHALTWRLVAGQPHAFDLLGTEPSAQPEGGAMLEADDGRQILASVAPVPGRGLRVTILEPKALRHGQSYRVTVAYTVNLVDTGELARERTAYRLAWKAPTPTEGYEGPKVTFVLPAALEPPSALLGEGGMRDEGVVATLRRAADHDEVQLVRPHVGRGEEVLWAVRVGARAFDGGKSPALAPPPPPPRHDEPAGPSSLAYAVVALLSLAFAAAVGLKDRRFQAMGRPFAEPARGLVPLRSWERAAAAGASLFAGLSLQIVDAPRTGAVAVALAMLCSVLRPPRASAPPRGPGRWLALRPEEAFARPRGTVASVLTVAASLTFGVGLFVLAGRLLASTHPEAPLLLPLDALVLLPLFATGLPSQLPPDRAAHGGPWLSRLFRRLQRNRRLRVSPWARVPTGLASPDEVRVLVVPRDPMPGLAGIEVGFAWGRAATSFVATPQVLVRVHEATAASARMTTLAPEVMPVPGRKPEERVFRLVPRLPSRAATAELVESLGRRLMDRRVSELGWESEERRVPPAVREQAAMALAG